MRTLNPAAGTGAGSDDTAHGSSAMPRKERQPYTVEQLEDFVASLSDHEFAELAYIIETTEEGPTGSQD
jgi:hypothetical protein